MPSAPGLSPELPPLSKNRGDSELESLLCLSSTFLRASRRSTALSGGWRSTLIKTRSWLWSETKTGSCKPQ